MPSAMFGRHMHEVYASFTGQDKANQPPVKRKWRKGVNDSGTSTLAASFDGMRPTPFCALLICFVMGQVCGAGNAL